MMSLIYRNHELQKKADQGGLRWDLHYTRIASIRLLRWDTQVLAILRYGNHEDFRALVMPNGAWQRARPRGWEHDVQVVDRCLGLRPGTVVTALAQSVRILPPGYGLNQWTDVQHSADFDYKAHFKKIREEAPEYLLSGIYRFIKQQRHAAYLERHRYRMEDVLPAEVLSQIQDYFSEQAKVFSCMDNFRAAEVGNRRQMRHYRRQRESGCCGSSDTVLELPQGLFAVGFNYGH